MIPLPPRSTRPAPLVPYTTLVRSRVLLQADDQAGLALCRLVVDVGDALDLAGRHQLGDAGRGGRDRRLVGHLGDDDLVALASGRALLDLGEGADADRA